MRSGAVKPRLPGLAMVLLCGVVSEAAADPLTLSCRGRTLSYTPDYSVHLGTVEPFEFKVVLDLARGRLLSAPVDDPSQFRFSDAYDAVFFFRDGFIAQHRALEWISISRISGAYAHFIAPRDTAAAGPASPLLIAAADCKLQKTGRPE